ncbi:MAG: hypothetical protein IJ635_12500, partial [Bacteroidaceae bacterium]|nr:hypothetical protein [Bacteroidaceae bacterium]
LHSLKLKYKKGIDICLLTPDPAAVFRRGRGAALSDFICVRSLSKNYLSKPPFRKASAKVQPFRETAKLFMKFFQKKETFFVKIMNFARFFKAK